ncbi:hypothetical protein DUNSADRAFT_10613 [Dunaliella salina]|uniref:Encoded protein n=1 Tax=Dunaliella salina TaxID=3046 RepID=A0ABQ7GEX5_DUNSA|nr:hypothetical protein DUNSADRAFT_10613 [Dunaliella salina]|eukprot:KAF5833163.1 hypothetical protein DUNSADRAFT_10613 [Dunaliella salina]
MSCTWTLRCGDHLWFHEPRALHGHRGLQCSHRVMNAKATCAAVGSSCHDH